MLNFFKYRYLRRIRKRISGHYIFEKNNKHAWSANLRRSLMNLVIKFEELKFSKFIFHNDFKEAEIALHQNIKNFFYNVNAGISSTAFDEAIKQYFSNKKYESSFNIIMPYQHFQFLKKQNINVSKKLWFLTWHLYLIKKIFMGLFVGFFFIINNFKCLFKKNLNEKYIHVENLDVLKNLDQIDNQKESFFLNKIIDVEKISLSSKLNIYIGPIIGNNIKFYLKKYKNFDNKKFLIKYEVPPCLSLYNILDNLKFIGWFVISLVIIFFSFFSGRWWNIILFDDSIKKYLIKFSSNKNTPQIFIRTFNGNVEYPMSIPELKKKGCKVIFCFYSINGEGYLTEQHNPIDHSSWGHLKWDYIYCWNNYHKKYLIDNLKLNNNYDPDKITFNVVGPIGFNILKRRNNFNFNQNKNICVFDIRIRKTIIRSKSSYYSILDAKYVSKFLFDISETCLELNINMLHKEKRFSSKISPDHKKYSSTLLSLKHNKNYFNIDYETCVEDIMDNSIASISLPYTSIPFMSNKPAVYYDPLNKIISNEKNGIKIIKNKNDLKKWLKFLLNK